MLLGGEVVLVTDLANFPSVEVALACELLVDEALLCWRVGGGCVVQTHGY